MDQQKALELLREANQRVRDAQQALNAAEAARSETRQAIAVSMGPFKIGDRVQREGDTSVYEIVRADLFVVRSEVVYPEFYGRRILPNGKVSVKDEKYIVNAVDEKWHLVSLPQ